MTSLPESWGLKRIKKEFDVGDRMAKRAKKLQSEHGFMSVPESQTRSDCLTNEIQEIIVNFYATDTISRAMPGKNDCLSMKINGVKQKVQKRLLLCSLKEAYLVFKEENQAIKVGFSSFANLRPKNVVIPGASGTHSVCVCTYHQNVKLMIENSKMYTIQLGSQGKNSYKDFLRLTMCEPAQEKCWLGECDQCPGNNALKEKITEFFEEEDIEEIRFKQWITVDRTSLEENIKQVDEFVDSFLSQLEALKTHSFIASAQSSFFQETKKNLATGCVLIGGDFAENYHFIVQDAAQGFHWSNDQVTIHPFIVYYRDANGELVNLNVAIISDELVHDTKAVYVFQRKLIEHLKALCIPMDKIIYFSDGCAAQYKNRKNFINLVHHEQDFGMPADWHFFATSHGKGKLFYQSYGI